MDPGRRCHEMKDNLTGNLWFKYECPLVSSFQNMDLEKNLNVVRNERERERNGNEDDRDNYNSDMHFMQSS